MNHRTFLTRVLAGTAGLALGAELDLERLLWVPIRINDRRRVA